MTSWNITVADSTKTSIGIHWQNLGPIANQRVLHYIGVISSSNGTILNAVIVSGNTTYANIPGLSPYTEYQVSVAGVNSEGQPHKSFGVSAWTKEEGSYVLFFLS